MQHKPWRITIDTNPDQCNLKCTMCDTHSIYNQNNIKRQRMDPSILDNLIQQATQAGVKEIIPSTMGEPLLYPHFDKFIIGLQGTSTKLNLTTNGTFPKKGAEIWADQLLPITTDTKISINGISPDKNEAIMIQANTLEALENIKCYLAIRDEVRETCEHQPTVTLQVTFMKNSLSGIKEVIEFAIKHHVDRVKGHHLWVTHPELEKEDLRHPDNKDIWNDFIDEISPFNQYIKLENFTKLSENSSIPESYHCPFLGNELWIDHSGKYNVCCAPSEQRKSLGDFGGVSEIPIDKVFSSEAYQELMNKYKSHELCQNCLLRKP